MIDSKPVQAAEDWGVVLQSVPSKNKKEILKRLAEIFQIDKRDAEQILSNMPLILVDNLSFGLAARIKKFFLTIGAVVETTNHDMIKKNCFQVLWPQTPDLSFFMKHEVGSAEVSAQGKKGKAKSGGFSFFEKKDEKKEMNLEMSKPQEAPLSAKSAPLGSPLPVVPTQESPATAPLGSPLPVIPTQESPATAPLGSPLPVMPTQESSAIVPPSPPAPETPAPDSLPAFAEKPVPASPAGADLDWERRANELNEKLRKFHAEKQELHAQHAEAAEKVKGEYQQQLEEEKKKSDEIAKALEDLHQREAQKQEALTREGEEWRSRAEALAQKVEKEKQKSEETAKALEDLHRKEAQKQEALTREGEEWRSRAEALASKVRELETNLTQKTSEVEQLIQQKADLSERSEKAAAEIQREISALRSREQESFQKIEGLERSVQEMTESLRSRDGVLAQFEKQIVELAEKSRGYESLRREHAQLAQERATIRQEYDAKLDEREMRLAKAEEDHRRYRSRTDRKNAAAARELGEWIRGIDTIRQGLQKLILFLGSESAVLDGEKKSNLKSPLTRGPDAPNTENG
ncbi:MAG: hypothetical protein ABH891_03570 [Candidatus Omnitrophota bacterium]